MFQINLNYIKNRRTKAKHMNFKIAKIRLQANTKVVHPDLSMKNLNKTKQMIIINFRMT